MNERKLKIIRTIGISVNTIIVIITLITVFVLKEQLHVQLFGLFIIVLQIFSIVLGGLYQRKVDNFIFKGNKKELLEQVNPDRYKNSIQGAREELRNGLNILMTVSIICCLLWLISAQDILKPAMCICLLWITYMYADYLPHAKAYAQKYDCLFLKEGEKPIAARGLARIYLEEYQCTKFDKGNKSYKNLNSYDFDEKSLQKDECIKSILRMGIDSTNGLGMIFSSIITFFNVIFIIPNTMEFLISGFLKNVTINTTIIASILLLILNIVFFAINLSDIYNYKEKCEKIERLASLVTKGSPEKRFEEYKENFEKYKTVRARGIFVFCASEIDKGSSLDTIDMKYRMLFTHRLDANISRFWTTVVLSGAALLFLLIDMGVNWKIILIVSIIFAIAVVIFRFFILERIGKNNIVKQCEELLAAKEENPCDTDEDLTGDSSINKT